jgi:hypothetical protein
MKIGISGAGRSGKDTAAEYLASITELRYVAGTSYWARHLVFARTKELGCHYPDADAAWHDRHNHRQFWADVIGAYNRLDPVQLYRDCLADQDMLTGVRWRHEQAACRAADLVDLWVWIDRPGIPPDPTMDYGPEACDLVIDNSGTLEQFHANLRAFAARFGLLSNLKAAA